MAKSCYNFLKVQVVRNQKKKQNSIRILKAKIVGQTKYIIYQLDIGSKKISRISEHKNQNLEEPQEIDFDLWKSKIIRFIDKNFIYAISSSFDDFLEDDVYEKCKEFGSVKTTRRTKNGNPLYVYVYAMKILEDDREYVYLMIADCSSNIGIKEEIKSEEKEKGFVHDFISAVAENVYKKIFKIYFDDCSVSEIELKEGVLHEVPLPKTWKNLCADVANYTDQKDIPKLLKFSTDIVNRGRHKGEMFTISLRTTYFTHDSNYSWYFWIGKIFNGYAFLFIVDDTSHVNDCVSMNNDTIREDQYKRAIFADAVFMYEFNLSKNLIIGNPIQRVDDKIVNLRESHNLGDLCKYTDFIRIASQEMSDEEQAIFSKHMSPDFLFKNFSEGKHELWFDTNRITYDGESFWARTTIILTKDNKTKDIMGLAVVKNITNAHYLEEEKLYQLEVINALSLDYTNVFMVNLITNKVRVVRLNDKVGAFYSETFGDQFYDDALDLYVGVSVYEGDQDMMRIAFSRDNILRQLTQKESFYVNYRSFINNKLAYMKLKAVRMGEIRMNNNILLGFMNVDEEIEHEMKQKKMLQDALLMAESASKAKTVFLSNMSHDIRTPMNAIMGFTTLAESHLDNKKDVAEYLKRIQSSSKHLLTLINDVLDMSRIESGKVKLQTEPTTIRDIIYNVNNVIQQQADAKHINYQIVQSGDLTKRINCDSLKLNQILINVLGNAVKYTHDYGCVKFLITEMTSNSKDTSSYQFRIKDNGIGMSKGFQENLFKAFERDENKANYQIQGTGLGLAITKSFIDLMGGCVFVKSELEKGTEFLICFDFENVYGETELQDSIETKETVDYTQKRYDGVRILLVEDNELNRDIVREILGSLGFIIEEAFNGEEAIKMVTENPSGHYKVILMDVQMPVMNGYDSSKAIRSLPDEEKATIPIIAMTANAFDEDRKQAMNVGMDSFVSKPFDIQDLLYNLDYMIKIGKHKIA